MLSDFQRKVAEVVDRIPLGTVLGYGEVAMLAGRPGGARAVVRALQSAALRELPWWRVVRSDRTLAEQVAPDQARLLRAEGLTIEGLRIVARETQSAPARKAQRMPAGRAATDTAKPRKERSSGPSRRQPRRRR